MAIKQKTVITMNMAGDCVSHSRTDVSVRGLTTIVDEPVERGGTNLGMSPTEMLMTSLIACTNVIGHKSAAKNGVVLDDMSIDLEAQFDRRGVTLQTEVDVPFPEIVLHINITTSSDDAAIEAMKDDLHRFCPVAKVIGSCGSNLREEWTVTRP